MSLWLGIVSCAVLLVRTDLEHRGVHSVVSDAIDLSDVQDVDMLMEKFKFRTSDDELIAIRDSLRLYLLRMSDLCEVLNRQPKTTKSEIRYVRRNQRKAKRLLREVEQTMQNPRWWQRWHLDIVAGIAIILLMVGIPAFLVLKKHLKRDKDENRTR